MTSENPQLFQCGKNDYINQTYTPQELYDCGKHEGRRKNHYDSFLYKPFTIYEPEPSPWTFRCGLKGFTNSTYEARDFWACGYEEGKIMKVNSGARNFKCSRSLVKIMIFLMLITYAAV
ncbi:YDL241W-like protein [Saccharomyces kudriavzevii IFO 1802]|uniref:YDL241W-like protein n=1 Tax=Saccharomyces kudriavzevii (strain ATCC MYA-4449 / AS 2.2408 / CBS 8840 / NBRC 1802 / NCYC 2889) TaxID=226230 RepID=J5RHN9_SACK1|nr:YDL241W-like protein [Saccharomyces kudriavzevii IFO 1802]